ncbi:dTMP kinase [Streptomyces sp. SID8379]|uniref:dTMP kinase n=1 Tax=unclassified Streptomyces TaxID=2593676 RepID=UPI0003743E9A|nr:dTMP kinase [Streptomyces sp. HmicA12]MYW67163.1 dTMP kinase [Streptomyces sp. SID8379]
MTRGFFVTVDGPSGVGKSTTINALRRLLEDQGRDVLLTTEPPRTTLGAFTRQNAGTLHGLSLACLVAAARYEHIDTVITAAMEDGRLLISDRYIASTLVLQRLDGVPLDFLLALNQHAPNPDLAVILTASPDTIAERIAAAGITHRFRGDPKGPDQEVELYAQAAELLEQRGVDVLRVNSSAITPSAVAGRIAEAILHRRLPSVPSQALPTPRES